MEHLQVIGSCGYMDSNGRMVNNGLTRTRKMGGDQGKKKRPWLRGVIIAVAIVIVGVSVWAGIFQRNNIKAVYLALTMDQDSLSKRQEEQEKKQEELLNQYGLSKPDISQEETQAPTEEGDAQDTQDQEGQQNQQGETQSGESSSAGSSGQQSAEQAKEEIQGYVNQLYQVEAKYRGRLNSMIASAKQEFYALPKEERTQKKKISIVQAKASALIAEENSCDAEVEAILAKIQAVLDRQNDKSNLVAEIRAYYQESKASWKAAQMTELYS